MSDTAKLRLLRVSILFLAMLSYGLVSVPASAKVVIKLGTIAPEGSAWHDALLRVRQQWHDDSDGGVELRIYAGGVLGGETEMVRKMRRRGLDAVAISGAGLPQIDTSIDCLNMPLLFESYEELDYVRSAIQGDLEKQLMARNVKILNWAEAGWVYFFAKQPVRTPDDLRKLRLWTAVGHLESERLFKHFGFRVVPLDETDMLTALRTGLIEAIDVPPLFALLDRSYQAANYMTELRWAPLNAATVIHVDAWKRIPDKFRTPLVAAAQSVGERLRDQIRKSEQDAIREMQTRGLQIVRLDNAAVELWRTVVIEAYPLLQCAKKHPQLFAKIMRLHEQYKSSTRKHRNGQ
jgi:TRAP-type C4-dicarboxylate transport system substrate-binding protein